jgi:hypothetical protein
MLTVWVSNNTLSCSYMLLSPETAAHSNTAGVWYGVIQSNKSRCGGGKWAAGDEVVSYP